MENAFSGEGQMIVTAFADWVKDLTTQAQAVRKPAALEALERLVREQGQALLCQLLTTLTQAAVDQQQEPARLCPGCGRKRRHQGVRPRHLCSSLGKMTVSGVYWPCPGCGLCGHTLDMLVEGSMTGVLRAMVIAAGTAAASFDKAEVLVRALSAIKTDDETIRRVCLSRGRELARAEAVPTRVPGPRTSATPPAAPPAKPPATSPVKCDVVVGSQDVVMGACDGTMVNTRQRGWSELKVLRFDHGGRTQAQGYLEKAAEFLPRLPRAAATLGTPAVAGVFVSDCAKWMPPPEAAANAGRQRAPPGLPARRRSLPYPPAPACHRRSPVWQGTPRGPEMVGHDGPTAHRTGRGKARRPPAAAGVVLHRPDAPAGGAGPGQVPGPPWPEDQLPRDDQGRPPGRLGGHREPVQATGYKTQVLRQAMEHHERHPHGTAHLLVGHGALHVRPAGYSIATTTLSYTPAR